MNDTLKEIVSEVGVSFLHELTDNLDKYILRLEFLLWGKTKTYTGPLADGFETYEWISISLLLSDWLIETMVDANLHNNASIVIKELRENPKEIAAFTLELLTKLIEHDVIKIDKKREVLMFLQNQMIINAIFTHADDVIDVVKKIFNKTCNYCRKKNKIIKITERDGNKAYKLSRSLTKLH